MAGTTQVTSSSSGERETRGPLSSTISLEQFQNLASLTQQLTIAEWARSKPGQYPNLNPTIAENIVLKRLFASLASESQEPTIQEIQLYALVDKDDEEQLDLIYGTQESYDVFIVFPRVNGTCGILTVNRFSLGRVLTGNDDRDVCIKAADELVVNRAENISPGDTDLQHDLIHTIKNFDSAIGPLHRQYKDIEQRQQGRRLNGSPIYIGLRKLYQGQNRALLEYFEVCNALEKKYPELKGKLYTIEGTDQSYSDIRHVRIWLRGLNGHILEYINARASGKEPKSVRPTLSGVDESTSFSLVSEICGGEDDYEDVCDLIRSRLRDQEAGTFEEMAN